MGNAGTHNSNVPQDGGSIKSTNLTFTTNSGSVQNAFGSNTTGNPPRAQLTITVGSGSININKASAPAA